MITLTRAYYFSASHRLHVAQFSDQRNQDLFGKCNNPHGHGHNYRLEISVRGEIEQATGRVVDLSRLDEIVNDRIVKYFDHKYINQDLPEFSTKVATTEILGEVINDRLQAVWPKEFPKLEKVGVQETLRNRFTIPASK